MPGCRKLRKRRMARDYRRDPRTSVSKHGVQSAGSSDWQPRHCERAVFDRAQDAMRDPTHSRLKVRQGHACAASHRSDERERGGPEAPSHRPRVGLSMKRARRHRDGNQGSGLGMQQCRSTIAMIERVARASGVEVEIIKVENPEEIKRFGVHSTPAVIIDGKTVHSGGLPSHEEVQGWLKPGLMGFLSQPTRRARVAGPLNQPIRCEGWSARGPWTCGPTFAKSAAAFAHRHDPVASPSTRTLPKALRCSPSTRLPTAATMRLTWWYLPSFSVSRSPHSPLVSQAAARTVSWSS